MYKCRRCHKKTKTRAELKCTRCDETLAAEAGTTPTWTTAHYEMVPDPKGFSGGGGSFAGGGASGRWEDSGSSGGD